MKCPGQDRQFWSIDDIFEVPCPVCGQPVEFFKDDVTRTCPHCDYQLRNPELDMGCAEWCAYAKQCLGAQGLPIVPSGSQNDKQA